MRCSPYFGGRLRCSRDDSRYSRYDIFGRTSPASIPAIPIARVVPDPIQSFPGREAAPTDTRRQRLVHRAPRFEHHQDFVGVTGVRRKISSPTAAAMAFTTAPNPAPTGDSPTPCAPTGLRVGQTDGRPLHVRGRIENRGGRHGALIWPRRARTRHGRILPRVECGR